MKKIGTYYFLLLTVLNALAGYGYGHFTSIMLKEYTHRFGGRPLPQLTTVFLGIPWWPYIFVALCVLGLVLGVATRLQNNVLLHVVILILMIEGYILFMASIAFAIPFVAIYT
ncbi:MAG: hypothetical protein PHI84_20215 [Kiritimatiellae bacterium]|nr:hypothetical protein [Kiritimatiellia bacterium]